MAISTPTVIDKTVGIINDLFSEQSAMYWQTVIPEKVRAATLAPSGPESHKSIKIQQGCDISLLSQLKEQLLGLFGKRPVSETFWSSVASHIVQAISGPLFSYKQISQSREANIRAYLIEPVLRELTRHLSNLEVEASPPEGCSLFTACLNMEQSIPLHTGSGKPASVDFCIIVRDQHGVVLNIVPGEAKRDMKDFADFCKQLSVYMWKVSTCTAYLGRSVVGLLMDHMWFRIAFCPLSYDDGSIIPVTFMTPPITWRQVDISPVAVDLGGLLLLSTAMCMNLQSIKSVQPFCNEALLKDVSRKLNESPLVLEESLGSVHNSFMKVMHDMEIMKEQLETLKEADIKQREEINTLKHENMKQRISLDQVQTMLKPAVSPSVSATPTSGRKRKRRSSWGTSVEELEL